MIPAIKLFIPQLHPNLVTRPRLLQLLEVLHLVTAGLSNSQITDKLIVSVGAVKHHLNNICGKLRVGSRTQAIALLQNECDVA